MTENSSRFKTISFEARLPASPNTFHILGDFTLSYTAIQLSSEIILLNQAEVWVYNKLQLRNQPVFTKTHISGPSRLVSRPSLTIIDDMEPDWVPPSNDPEDQAYSTKDIEPFNLEGYKKSAV